MKLLTYFFPRTLASSGSRFNKKIEVVESSGTKQLLVDGIVQTGVYTQKMFARGLKKLASWHNSEMNQMLVFGVGGGGIFTQVCSIYPQVEITGVDIDPEIIRLAKEQFHVDALGKLHLVVSDAFEFAKKSAKQKKLFDCVIIDIYIGNDVPEFVTSKKFLQSVASILRNRGSVMFNYFSFTDQPKKACAVLETSQHIFSEIIMESNARNIFFYCRN